jgi:hypothetical protein
VLAAFLVLGGCTVGAEPATPGPLATLDIPAAPTPLPTERPTPAPLVTPSPTPVASPTPEAETGAGLAADLRIGSPYKLAANRGNKALTASFTFDYAGSHVEVAVNGREIWQRGDLVGVALVMEMSGIDMNEEVFEAAATSGGSSRATFSTILGETVAFADNGQRTIGMYVLRGKIVMVGGVDAAATKALLTSVIGAN